MLTITAVGYETDMQRNKAEKLAIQLRLRVDNEVLPRLCVTANQLVLLTEDFTPLFVNFDEEYAQKRRHEGKNQGLIRACAPKKGMTIIDATAGWGKDAMILASFGAKVCMIERQPMMAALLADALERLDEHASLKQTLSLIESVDDGSKILTAPTFHDFSEDKLFGLGLEMNNQPSLGIDAKFYLNNLAEEDYPDVIYIDPMHPLRQKSALVKKNMQFLQQWMGPDEDADELIDIALLRAKDRVVVKWPQKGQLSRLSHWSISGKTVCFHVYNTHLKLT